MEGFDPSKPIFLKTGNELTQEEQLRLVQLGVEALAHLTKAQAILDDMETKRKNWLFSQIKKPIF